MAGTPFIKFDRDTPWRWGLTRLDHELHVPPITAHLWLLYAVNRIIARYSGVAERSRCASPAIYRQANCVAMVSGRSDLPSGHPLLL